VASTRRRSATARQWLRGVAVASVSFVMRDSLPAVSSAAEERLLMQRVHPACASPLPSQAAFVTEHLQERQAESRGRISETQRDPGHPLSTFSSSTSSTVSNARGLSGSGGTERTVRTACSTSGR
jgi:hypothetical protein